MSFFRYQINSLLILSVLIILINGEKCSLNGNQWKCSEIMDMNDVITGIDPSVSKIIIENSIRNNFYLNEIPDSNSTRQITTLDYSGAGFLIISINSLKPYTLLAKLNLSNTGIEHLHTNWFNVNNQIEVLDVSKNKLISLERNGLITLKNVRLVNFSNNLITAIEKNAFNEWQNLEELLLQNNYITEMVDLGILRQLKVLNIGGNFLRKIEANTFSMMRELKSLFLGQNSIEEIDEHAFNGTYRLEILDLSKNYLFELNPNLFTVFERGNLRELDLSNNNIRQLPVNIFNSLRLLEILHLNGNNLLELTPAMFTGLIYLKKLNLFVNKITKIESGTFAPLTELETLDLSHNELTTLDGSIFAVNHSKLQEIFIANNKLKMINGNTFRSMENINEINLSTNRLTTLPPTLFTSIKHLISLNIEYNKIEQLFSEFLNNLIFINTLKFAHNRLSFIPDIENAFHRLQIVSFEGNPWQCPCLHELLEWLNLKRISYRDDTSYFNGKKPLCITTPVHICVRNFPLVKQHRIVETYEHLIKTF